MAQKIAAAVLDCERQRTGHSPQTVNVVLNEDMLVIRLQGALSAAEQALVNLGLPVRAEEMKGLDAAYARRRVQFLGLPEAVTRAFGGVEGVGAGVGGLVGAAAGADDGALGEVVRTAPPFRCATPFTVPATMSAVNVLFSL